jgi:uncharacterized glyoxalase superfamily metalloenzyme YdcJ
MKGGATAALGELRGQQQQQQQQQQRRRQQQWQRQQQQTFLDFVAVYVACCFRVTLSMQSQLIVTLGASSGCYCGCFQAC